MFLNNKYYKWYSSIIDNAKDRSLDSYTEKHHIVPRSLGGTNCIDNLISLTPREHFIAHLLLTKFTEGKNKSKMITAAFTMVHRNKEKINSRLYETLRTAHKDNMKRSNPMHDPEIRKKVSNTNKGKISKRKGIPMSEESKRKISEKAKGRTAWNKGKKLNYNNGLITHTEESIAKIKQARAKQVMKKRSEETKIKMSESAKKRWQREKNASK